jgi:hypothetical protein
MSLSAEKRVLSMFRAVILAQFLVIAECLSTVIKPFLRYSQGPSGNTSSATGGRNPREVHFVLIAPITGL